MSGQNYFGKDSILPDFLNNNSESKLYNEQIKTLKSAEEAATSDNPSEILQNSNDLENSFKYTGKGKAATNVLKSANKSSRLKSKLLKQSPLLAVFALIVLGIFFALSSVGTLGNQLETLITRATDTMFGSYSENTMRVVEELMEGKRGNFSTYFEERLNAQNISVVPAGEGYNLLFNSKTITADNLRSEYRSDIEFRDAFTKAKRGRTSNFYDIPATFVYTKLGLSRNLFRNFRSTGDNDTDTANYRATESSIFEDSTSASVNTVTEKQKVDENGEPVVDSNGEPVMERVRTGDDISNKTTVGDTPKAKASSYLLEASSRVGDAGNWTCAALKTANIISTTVAAAEMYQAISYFINNMENISKTKAGYGDSAAANQFYNKLSEPITTTYIDSNSGEEKTVTGSMMESEGIISQLTGERPETNKTKNYSYNSAFITSMIALTSNGITRHACGTVRAATAAISIAVGIFSGGLMKSIASLIKPIVINVAMSATIAATLGSLVPRIAKALFTNTFDDLEGIPAGEKLAEGAALANKRISRSAGGQMLANETNATAYQTYTNIAANYEAELDRAYKSPLDTSSPNTFLGSLVRKFAVIGGTTNVINTISSIGSLISPKALATDNFTVDTDLAGTDFNTIYGDDKICENLKDIGATCDIYGGEVTSASVDTIKIASDDPEYQRVINENTEVDESGFRQVIPNSLLANKIMFCDERDSPFGVYDTNIANAFQISLGFGDSLPFIGDVIDIVNAFDEMSPETEGWALGSFCVMNEETNPYYHDMIYLQHYIDDQRVASTLKLDEVTDENGNDRNSVIAYKNDYYKLNPIDNSKAGLLARYTGTTKDQAEEILAMLYLEDYLANYIPPKLDNTKYQYFYNNYQEETIYGITSQNIIYEDYKSQGVTA